MRDSSMFYFNISINYCAGCKYSPHPWLALGAREAEPAKKDIESYSVVKPAREGYYTGMRKHAHRLGLWPVRGVWQAISIGCAVIVAGCAIAGCSRAPSAPAAALDSLSG